MADIIFACDLDERICRHISRGNQQAFDIICTYHMDEIKQIRDTMVNVLRENFYDARQLNYAFNSAVSSLGINLVDLINPEVKVVSTKETSVRKLA